MKEKKLYTCEVCHTDYSEKANAIKCEKNHKVNLKVVSTKHYPYTMEETGFPIKITLSDGNREIEYRR